MVRRTRRGTYVVERSPLFVIRGNFVTKTICNVGCHRQGCRSDTARVVLRPENPSLYRIRKLDFKRWPKGNNAGSNPPDFMRVFFTLSRCSTHQHPAQPKSVLTPHRETSSVVINYETEVHIANAARLFGHAMPTAMSTRAKNKQKSSQHTRLFEL